MFIERSAARLALSFKQMSNWCEVHGSIRCIEAKRRKSTITSCPDVSQEYPKPVTMTHQEQQEREHIHLWDRASEWETFLIIRIRCWRQGWDIRYGWLSRNRSSRCRAIGIRWCRRLLQLIDRLLNIDVHQTLLNGKTTIFSFVQSLSKGRVQRNFNVQNPLVVTVEWMEYYRNGIPWSSLWMVNREPSFSLLRLLQK